ncbi:hypothetical protein NONO_c29090 [Nocardia nova SH22a]|uniref:GNAT family N-acetyltransferase n=1 Tax=Nocardia nova SH22a TaxID=1415166 RepID=W5TFA6_9NOCA|nr:hypothetical protein [Nocardia nova]AHH17698.1 hypothetical protein NONO_c29090 [Nocardia nova SH22a]
MRVASPIVPAVPAPWNVDIRSRTTRGADLELARSGGVRVGVRLRRCVAGRLRDSYPVAGHDIEVEVSDPSEPEVLADLLGTLVPALWKAEPRCRRIIFAPLADDERTVAAARSCGFRPVVEVDLAEATVLLMVAEPGWVTALDGGLDDVPGT